MPSSRQYEYFDDDPAFPSTLVISTLFVGAFIGFLNETLLNVALPTLMREFSVEKTTVQWMVTGFMLVMGALAPLTASLVQWLDTRRLTLVTLGTFLAGSLICATAPSFGLLLTGRLVQAVSAALTMPLLMNATLAIYPPERRGKVMGLVAMVFSAAPALGPTISGGHASICCRSCCRCWALVGWSTGAARFPRHPPYSWPCCCRYPC